MSLPPPRPFLWANLLPIEGKGWVVPDRNKTMATVNSTNDKNMIKEK